MYIVDLLTPIGIINLSFENELKDKDGNSKKFAVPIVFKDEEQAKEYLKKNLKDRKIYGYNIKYFTPWQDEQKI